MSSFHCRLFNVVFSFVNPPQLGRLELVELEVGDGHNGEEGEDHNLRRPSSYCIYFM